MFLFLFYETSFRREIFHFTEKCSSIIDYERYNKRHNVPLQ